MLFELHDIILHRLWKRAKAAKLAWLSLPAPPYDYDGVGHAAWVKAFKKDAQKELRRILQQIDEGSFVDRSKTTIREWIDKWLETIKNTIAAKTYQRYSENMRLHVVPYIPAYPVAVQL